ncbi:MAG: hypothetical protein ACMG6S_30490, partial [Byssovorax sp.]
PILTRVRDCAFRQRSLARDADLACSKLEAPHQMEANWLLATPGQDSRQATTSTGCYSKITDEGQSEAVTGGDEHLAPVEHFLRLLRESSGQDGSRFRIGLRCRLASTTKEDEWGPSAQQQQKGEG